MSTIVTVATILFAPKLEIGIIGFVLMIGLIVTVSSKYISAPYVKRVRLQADNAAASAVGTTYFLQILHKINGLGMQDLTRLAQQGGIRTRLNGRPTINERIRNLSSPDLATTA